MRYGWELSLEGFGFDPELIWVTVFAGDEELGLGARRGGDRDLARDRRPRGAHRAPAALGELLAGRADRALRAVLGDVHRPRPRVRRRRPAPRRRHRPLPRVLEPRLHDLRAARGRLADRAAAAQHRHRARARADGGDPAGRRLGLRHRRLRAADRARRGALGRQLRLRPEGDPGDADHRRPHARRGQPDRRRGRALERGSRLRAAPDHAPRDPAGAGAGARAAVPRPLRRAGDRADGAAPIRTSRPSGRPIMRWVGDEEESFGRTLDRGTELLAKLVAEAKEAEHVVDRRRGRLPAPRHLRLSLRPDQGAARRGGPRGRRRGLRGADGRSSASAPAAAPRSRPPTATRR